MVRKKTNGLPVEIPLADDAGHGDTADATEDPPSPDPNQRYEKYEKASIWPDVEYPGVLSGMSPISDRTEANEQG